MFINQEMYQEINQLVAAGNLADLTLEQLAWLMNALDAYRNKEEELQKLADRWDDDASEDETEYGMALGACAAAMRDTLEGEV